MTDNVVRLSTATKADIPSNLVLQAAMFAEVEDVLVVGRGEDGSLYFAAAPADLRDVAWLLRLAGLKVDEMAEEMDA